MSKNFDCSTLDCLLKRFVFATRELKKSKIKVMMMIKELSNLKIKFKKM